MYPNRYTLKDVLWSAVGGINIGNALQIMTTSDHPWRVAIAFWLMVVGLGVVSISCLPRKELP